MFLGRKDRVMSLVEWFNVKTGRRFWYSVKFKYRRKDGVWLTKRVMEIGLAEKNEILNHRNTKKFLVPAMILGMRKDCPHLLQNGYVTIERISYLGWFKKG